MRLLSGYAQHAPHCDSHQPDVVLYFALTTTPCLFAKAAKGFGPTAHGYLNGCVGQTIVMHTVLVWRVQVCKTAVCSGCCSSGSGAFFVSASSMLVTT